MALPLVSVDLQCGERAIPYGSARIDDESPGVEGLGLIAPPATRFSGPIRVPQMGWNDLRPEPGCRLLTPGAAYFANSYRLTAAPEGWSVAWSDHGGPFVAAMERGEVLACQCHPELSGAWGADLLGRWLRASRSTGQGEAPQGRGGLKHRVIPCLDVRHGRVVKGVRFQGLRDAGDPVERAAAYESQGADELVVLDVSATREGRGAQIDTVRQVRRELSMPLTVGGGVRSADDAGELLAAGADKVSVNTAAVLRPEVLSEIAERYGRQCTVVAIDAARAESGGWEVVIRAGTERRALDAIEWVRRAVALGAGEVLLTSWDRDGTRSGYDLALLRAVSEAVQVPLIASGGADTAGHMQDALAAGADAVLAASIFHDGHTTILDVKRELARLGAEVRL